MDVVKESFNEEMYLDINESPKSYNKHVNENSYDNDDDESSEEIDNGSDHVLVNRK